jgi:hypothetical protein
MLKELGSMNMVTVWKILLIENGVFYKMIVHKI